MNTKKLKKQISISDFINTVKKCTGDVRLTTQEGDLLNLKSALCQYIFVFAASAATADYFGNAEIYCQLPEDFDLLADYITD